MTHNDSVRVENATRATVIADAGRRASTFLERGKGLMFQDTLDHGSCLVIDPCSSIHMFGMRFPIDVLYVGNDDRVVRIQECLKPWRVGPLYTRGAKYVIELPTGSIQESATRAGDQLRIVTSS
jgi:uncharacterized protein